MLESEDSFSYEAAHSGKDPKVNVPGAVPDSVQGSGKERLLLAGLKVFIIHVKETLKDGPEPGETILAQLEQAEKAEELGCTFSISRAGDSIWL